MEASTTTNPALISVKASLTRMTPLGRGRLALLPPGFLAPRGGWWDLVEELSVLLGARVLFFGGFLSGELP